MWKIVGEIVAEWATRSWMFGGCLERDVYVSGWFDLNIIWLWRFMREIFSWIDMLFVDEEFTDPCLVDFNHCAIFST